MKISDKALTPILSSRGLLGRLPGELPDLLTEIELDMDAGNKFMRLFFILQSMQMDAFAQEIQDKALEHRNTFRLLSPESPKVRLLAIAGPGNMVDNAPLDFVLFNQDVQLDFFYVTGPNQSWDEIPEHDVAILALSESSKNIPLLKQIEEKRKIWPRPFLNSSEAVIRCSRDKLYELLKDVPDLLIPHTKRVAAEFIHAEKLPFLIRPIDTHAGDGFAKIEREAHLESYSSENPAEYFYISEYIDCSKEDGLFRKFRLVLINKTPYVCHLAISDNWIVHYISAHMELSSARRDEEAKFMRDFDSVFLKIHGRCLSRIAEEIGLDYVVLDCAESKDGKLILFEADNAAWIHDVDSPSVYPYKAEVMNRAFSAFTDMLLSVSGAVPLET